MLLIQSGGFLPKGRQPAPAHRQSHWVEKIPLRTRQLRLHLCYSIHMSTDSLLPLLLVMVFITIVLPVSFIVWFTVRPMRVRRNSEYGQHRRISR